MAQVRFLVCIARPDAYRPCPGIHMRVHKVPGRALHGTYSVVYNANCCATIGIGGLGDMIIPYAPTRRDMPLFNGHCT
jgi:hypothetical protein